MTMIADNLYQLHQRIAQAATDAGRTTDDVQLLAVSKTFGPEDVREAALAGQRAFGENYIQEAIEKMALVRAYNDVPALEWHCIGPVQSNKTRLVAEHFDWMHTLDRLKIAERLSAQRPEGLPALQVCLQVNWDGGVSKSGVSPDEILPLVKSVAHLPRLQLRGLMSIPEPVADYQAQREVFMGIRRLFNDIAESHLAGLEHWDTLSLGMTADMEAAVHCGSTLVRVGTGVFGRRPVLVA